MNFSEKHSFIRPVIVGQFGPPTLTCIRSWGKQGFPVGMVCIRSERELYPASKYLSDFTTLPPSKLYASEGMQIISDFVKQFRASGIICVAEKIASWANDQRQMLPAEVALWIPSNQLINALISKQKQVEVARKIGFDVLPTYFVGKDLKTIHGIPEEHFPLCLRPTEPQTIEPAFKVQLVYSRGELIRFVKKISKIDKSIIAQPFMDLPNLVVHGARTISGTSIGLQAFLVERKFETVTLSIRPAVLEKGLEEKCIEFTNHFDVMGNYHFEFLIDRKNGSIYFLEINNRLGGTTAKVFACGYDEPLLALRAYGVVPIDHRPASLVQRSKNNTQQPATGNVDRATGGQQTESTAHRPLDNVTVSSKLALLKYLFYTINNRLTPLDYPSERKLNRIIKTIYGFLKYRDDVLMLRDLRGSCAFYFQSLKNSF
jgi:hypothetical protein